MKITGLAALALAIAAPALAQTSPSGGIGSLTPGNADAGARPGAGSALASRPRVTGRCRTGRPPAPRAAALEHSSQQGTAGDVFRRLHPADNHRPGHGRPRLGRASRAVRRHPRLHQGHRACHPAPRLAAVRDQPARDPWHAAHHGGAADRHLRSTAPARPPSRPRRRKHRCGDHAGRGLSAIGIGVPGLRAGRPVLAGAPRQQAADRPADDPPRRQHEERAAQQHHRQAQQHAAVGPVDMGRRLAPGGEPEGTGELEIVEPVARPQRAKRAATIAPGRAASSSAADSTRG